MASEATQKARVCVFSAKSYDKTFLPLVLSAHQRAGEPTSMTEALKDVEFVFHDFALSPGSASLARGCVAVCVFVNDVLSAPVLRELHGHGVRAILLRCAGYNNVDLDEAAALGLFVANVPAYSPEAVAEFAVTLLMTINRKTHRAYNRVREGNFALDGLLGRTVHGKTVGVVGLGRIGMAFARIMHGFGCELLAFDPFAASEEFTQKLGGKVCDKLEDLLPRCDFVSLHCPLMDSTKHIINEESLQLMKEGATLVNTSRGGLIKTKAVIDALKSGRLGGLALDVYEGESNIFYSDHSGEIIHDDQLMRLTTFPNVLVCGHQAFFTEEALHEISEVTMRNLADFLEKIPCKNSLVKERLKRRDSRPVRT